MKEAAAVVDGEKRPTVFFRGTRDRDAVFAAIVFTLLLHMFVYYAVPQSVGYVEVAAKSSQRTLDIILVPDEETREERYVMAAPDREQERPEDTPNISDRDQLAAQEEEALLSPDNTPRMEGEETDSNRIVQGNPFERSAPQPSFGGGEESDADSPMQERIAAPREATTASLLDAPEADLVEPEDHEGTRVVERRGEARVPSEEAMPDSVADAAFEERSPFDGTGREQLETPAQEASRSPAPRPRQRVERPTSYGPLLANPTGASRTGRVSFDAQYSEFGEYWTRVAEIIEQRWRNILYNSRSVAFRGARVTVEFKITREGEVEGARILHSNAGRLAETISLDAITSEAPYFRWTPEMILRMGEQSSFRMTFIY